MQAVASALSRFRSNEVGKWELKNSDLKRYPHFDALISSKAAASLATNPSHVAKHSFYPFIRYVQRWNRFADKGARGKPKERPIRYAARRDAYIFSYYRFVLSERYECELTRLGLDDSVLAYRRIADAAGGKCNIHFARDTVLKIQELGDCCVVALDISSFFESLDHALLKSLWARLLSVSFLPPDHFQVFKAMTKYAVVDKHQVYERLGHYGDKRKSKSGKLIKGYLTPFKAMPKQLCSGKDFREKIAGEGAAKSIIKKNFKPYGIPQGAPISDLLANLYLIDFDTVVSSWVKPLGGAYYRYSDDILIIAPGGVDAGRDLMARARALIGNFGSHMVIKDEKSSIFLFSRNSLGQECKLIHGTQGKNGLEYLGFRYDGRRVYLRDSTLSNLHRKMVRAARRDADACARRYPDKGVIALMHRFSYERLTKQFGKVEDFDEKSHDYRNWTFWTYATRAVELFGPAGKPIRRQLRRYREQIRHRVDLELARAVVRRERRKAA